VFLAVFSNWVKIPAQKQRRAEISKMDEIKAHFRGCMRRLCPDGVELNSQQLRTLALVFSAGWYSGLDSHGCYGGTDAFLRATRAMADPNWLPDESWEWWTDDREDAKNAKG
jgi:hypothetical protein